MRSQSWTGVDLGIVFGGSSEGVGMVFPEAVHRMCLGCAGDGPDPDLEPSDVARIEREANAIHRRTHWECPPNPAHLAVAASVQLGHLPAGAGLPALLKSDKALYAGTTDAQDDGLLAAFALASAIVLQQDLPWSPVFRWRLAAELLAPLWVLDESGSDHLEGPHPHAPEWLVRQRNLESQGTVANKRSRSVLTT